MKTLVFYHEKKIPGMPYFHKKHIMLPHFFQYTLLLWILFGGIVLLIFPVFLVAKVYKGVRGIFHR